jgi:hypothetical protein
MGRRSSLTLRFYEALLGFALALVVLNLGSGCGTMFNEKTTLVHVRANPPGARVFVDGLYVAEAPGEIQVTTANAHSIDLEADGYERQSTHLDSNPNGGYIALDCVLLVLLVVPGIIALVVDGSTGGWKTLDRDYVAASLVPAQAPAWYPPPPAPGQGWNPAPQAPQPGALPPAAPAGCQFDTQCKNNRICRAGQCVDPAPSR